MNSDDLIIRTDLVPNKQRTTENDQRSKSPNEMVESNIGKCNSLFLKM